MLTVILVAVTVKLLTAISGPPEPEIFAAVAVPVPALNRQPLGAVRMRVTPVPVAKSPLAPSRITMLPRVVKAGAVAFWALSADRLVPPVPAVMLTAACAPVALRNTRPNPNRPRTKRVPKAIRIRNEGRRCPVEGHNGTGRAGRAGTSVGPKANWHPRSRV